MAVARIYKGLQQKLFLGNLSAKRDWGYAKDYVECMWLMLQEDKPQDFVIATGQMRTVRDFCTLSFKEVGINLRWEGEGINEKGIDINTNEIIVEVDSQYYRACEVEELMGNPQKAKDVLGWNPNKTSFEDLVKIMVNHDLLLVSNKK